MFLNCGFWEAMVFYFEIGFVSIKRVFIKSFEEQMLFNTQLKLTDTMKNMEARKQRIKNREPFVFEDKPKLRGRHANEKLDEKKQAYQKINTSVLIRLKDMKEVGLKRLETSVKSKTAHPKAQKEIETSD